MKSRSRTEFRRARPLLGTIVEIVVPNIHAATAATDHAFAAIAQVDALMSAHSRSSDLRRLHDAPADVSVRVHPWTSRVLSAARRLHQITAGAFDPIAAGRFATLAGRLPHWPGSRSLQAGRWDDVSFFAKSRIRCRRPIRFDLGGIAKGFAVDRAVQVLRTAGMKWGLVNAGGDVRAFGSRDWPIHARHPAAPGQLVFIGILRDGALATSAPYFSTHCKEGLTESALFDPTSNRSITGPISVTVFARSCMVADALTKAVLIGHASHALRQCRARALILAEPEAVRHAA